MIQAAAAESAAAGTARPGTWARALDARAFVGWVHEATFKGGSRLGSSNWLALTASLRHRRGSLALRAMGSLETVTWGHCGYPRLLAAGGLRARDGFASTSTHTRR